MRKLILFISITFFGLHLYGQGQKPNTFIEETNPSDTNFEVYSQKNDLPRRASLYNLKKYFAPSIEPTPIAFTPAAAGNLQYLMQLVVDPVGDVYYIGSDGSSILLEKANSEDTNTNIFNTDDKLTGNRILDGDNNDLTFTKLNQFNMDAAVEAQIEAADSITLRSPGLIRIDGKDGLVLETDSEIELRLPNYTNVPEGAIPYLIDNSLDNGDIIYTPYGVPKSSGNDGWLWTYDVSGDTMAWTDPATFQDLDGDPVNEIQQLSENDNIVSLSNNGGQFDKRDDDSDPANELQTLSIFQDSIIISGGNAVRLNTNPHVVRLRSDVKNINSLLEVNDRIFVESSGAEYVVQTQTVADYNGGLADDYAVITASNGLYAVLDAKNGIHPEWLAAVGDGVTDDGAAIEKAIEYANAQHSHLIINNSYRIDTKISTTAISMKGGGTLIAGSVFNDNIIEVTGGTAKNVLIQDINFIGGDSTLTTFLRINSAKSVSISDCSFKNMTSSFLTRAVTASNVDNLFINNCVFEGIRAQGNNISADATGTVRAIFLQGFVNHATISDCIFRDIENRTSAGIFLKEDVDAIHALSSSNQRITVSNCMFDNFGNRAVKIQNTGNSFTLITENELSGGYSGMPDNVTARNNGGWSAFDIFSGESIVSNNIVPGGVMQGMLKIDGSIGHVNSVLVTDNQFFPEPQKFVDGTRTRFVEAFNITDSCRISVIGNNSIGTQKGVDIDGKGVFLISDNSIDVFNSGIELGEGGTAIINNNHIMSIDGIATNAGINIFDGLNEAIISQNNIDSFTVAVQFLLQSDAYKISVKDNSFTGNLSDFNNNNGSSSDIVWMFNTTDGTVFSTDITLVSRIVVEDNPIIINTDNNGLTVQGDNGNIRIRDIDASSRQSFLSLENPTRSWRIKNGNGGAFDGDLAFGLTLDETDDVMTLTNTTVVANKKLELLDTDEYPNSIMVAVLENGMVGYRNVETSPFWGTSVSIESLLNPVTTHTDTGQKEQIVKFSAIANNRSYQLPDPTADWKGKIIRLSITEIEDINQLLVTTVSGTATIGYDNDGAVTSIVFSGTSDGLTTSWMCVELPSGSFEWLKI